MEIFEKAYKYAEKCGLINIIRSSKRVICAYSGGADSTLLLHFLANVLKDSDTELTAAHLNHMIRGSEADGDQELCRITCEAMGIKFEALRLDIPKIAKERGMGLEECARIERYAFLHSLCGEDGVIATAHNLTDNAETMIFNMCRGSGMRGMTGIDPCNGKVIRPILCLSSDEIRGYLHSENIHYATDSTNSDTEYTRNYIRHKIMPGLCEINPKAPEAMLRLATVSREDCGFLEQLALDSIGEDGTIERQAAREMATPLLSRAIGFMYKRARGNASNLSSVHLLSCVEMVREGNGKISLPAGYAFYCHKDKIFVDLDSADSVVAPSEMKIGLETSTEFGSYTVFTSEKPFPKKENGTNIYNLSIQLPQDFDTMYGNILLRVRRAGDTVTMGGMRKKLKKLMCDFGIPQSERDLLPIICIGEEIAAVPGIGVADGYKKGSCTVNIKVYKN